MITLKNFYLHYPHKCVPNPNTIPNPYFPKTEMDCEHKHSLSYAQWSEIVEVILEEVMNYLLRGFNFILPEKLGEWAIVKMKNKEFRYMFSKDGDTCNRRLERDMNPYKPFLKWKKWFKHTKVADSTIWRIVILKKSKFAKILNKTFHKSPLIFNDNKKY
jgi:hypothetical protein